ncbi:MAG TPA: hypothetical protein VK039_11240, partial [Brevibacterium sp.]|nr:hypothetical protein [Brevibacterium sp.]
RRGKPVPSGFRAAEMQDDVDGLDVILHLGGRRIRAKMTAEEDEARAAGHPGPHTRQPRRTFRAG